MGYIARRKDSAAKRRQNNTLTNRKTSRRRWDPHVGVGVLTRPGAPPCLDQVHVTPRMPLKVQIVEVMGGAVGIYIYI